MRASADDQGSDKSAAAAVTVVQPAVSSASDGNGVSASVNGNGVAPEPILPYAANEALAKAVTELRAKQLSALQQGEEHGAL